MPEATGELFRATITHKCRGSTIQNVIHFRGTDIAATAPIVAGTLRSWYEDIGRLYMGSDTRFDNVMVQALTPLPLESAISTPTLTQGESTLTSFNLTLAAIITLRTGLAGKRKRGRIYLAGLPIDYQSNDVLSAEGVTKIKAWMASLWSMVGPGGTAGFRIGVYSRSEGGDGPTYNMSGFTEATGYVVRSLLGNQRRRRPGVGI